MHIGIAIPDLVFQSRDSGLALPGSRDPRIPEVPILKWIHARSRRYWLQLCIAIRYRLSLVAEWAHIWQLYKFQTV